MERPLGATIKDTAKREEEQDRNQSECTDACPDGLVCSVLPLVMDTTTMGSFCIAGYVISKECDAFDAIFRQISCLYDDGDDE